MNTLAFTADKAYIKEDGLAFIVGKELAVFHPTEVRVTVTDTYYPLFAPYSPHPEIMTKDITVAFHTDNEHGKVHVGEIIVEPEGIEYALFINNVIEYDN